MADESGSKPSWLPDWFPHHGHMQYAVTFLQLFVLGLAGVMLGYHLFRGNGSAIVGIVGNQAT
jgi:hypothetical protein